MKIKWTLSIYIGAVLILIMASSFFYIYKSQENQAEQSYYNQAKSISHDLGLVRHIIQGTGGIYVKKVNGIETNPYLAQVSGLDVDIKDEKGNNYTMLNSFAFIRQMTQQDIAFDPHENEFTYRIPSINAKNPINNATEFEREILHKFQNGEISEYASIELDENGSREYRYISPYIANEMCLKCHPFVENVGDVVGAISIRIPIEEAELIKEKSLNRILFFFFISSIIMMGMVYGVSDRMAKPIVTLSRASERIRKGELGVKVGNNCKTEEIATLGSTFNLMTTELQDKISQLSIDIALRKEAELKLKESEEKYRDLFENANDLIQSVDENGKFLFVNQKWLDTLGYSSNELDNLTFMDVLHNDQVLHCRNLLEDVKNGTSIDHVETIFMTKDGKEVIVEGNANGQFKDGKFLASRGIFRDITSRKKAEEAQAYLANITENSHDAIASLNLDGAFTSWNKGALEIFGYSKEEIIGKPHGFIVPDEMKHTCVNLLFNAEENGFIKGEGKRIAKDGREIPIESTLSRLDDSHGNHIGYTFIMRDITERKEAEKKLRMSEERYRDLFENANDLIQCVDKDGKFLYVNKKWLEVLGYSRDDLETMTMQDVLKEDQIPHCMGLLGDLQLEEGGAIDHIETIFLTKNGDEVIVEGNANGQFNNGKFIASRGIFRDISERKMVEDALEMERKKLRLLYENNPDAIVVLDTEYHIIYSNRKTQDIIGKTLQEIKGKPCHESVMGLDRICDGCKVEEVIRTKEPATRIKHEKTASGKDQWLQQLWYPILDKEGEVESVVEIARDITRQKLAEETIRKAKDELEMRVLERTAELGRANSQLINEINERKQAVVALRANEEKYSTLVEKGNDGIVIIQDGNLKFLNTKMMEITGFDSEMAIGRPFTEFISPDYKEMVITNYQKRMEGENVPTRYEIEIISKGGKNIPIEINTSVIDYENKPADMAIVRDITERKKSEEALKKAFEELKSIDTLKSDIFSNVSHELKTPITIIRASIELAMEDDHDSETMDLLKTVMDALRRQEGIINDLLVAADMGKIKLKINLENIDDMIEILVNQKSIVAKKNGIVIESEMGDDIPLIPIERAKIDHVLINLIDNAIKFNKKGGKVKVSCLRKDDNIEVSVEDTGDGIKEEDMQKLFQPLTQLDPSSRRAHGGTGTGLAVARAIIEAHGGKIWAESKYGHGSTFYFSIPLVRY